MARLPSTRRIVSVTEVPIGWAFYCQHADYRGPGDFDHVLFGNAPILVNRNDGTLIPTGTGAPLEHYIEVWERRQIWLRTASVLDIVTTDAVWCLTYWPRWATQVRLPIEGHPAGSDPDRVDHHAIGVGRVVVDLNDCFRRSHQDVDEEIIDQAATEATRIGQAAAELVQATPHATRPSVDAALEQLMTRFPKINPDAMANLMPEPCQ